jgi:hypothetical protein
MAEMRDKRVKREFAGLINQRKHSALNVLRTFKNAQLPETEIMPQGPDFCHFSAVSDVLNQTTDVEVDVSSFNDIIPLLPELVMEWRESIKREMIQLVKMHGRSYLDLELMMFELDGYIDEDMAALPNSHLTDEELCQKLALASTVFTCDCGDSYNDSSFYDSDDPDDYGSVYKVLFYPQVMGHSCLTRGPKRFLWELSASHPDPSCRLDSCRSERKRWDSSNLSLHTPASRTARDIIQLAGLDPDLATSHQMDQLEVRFGCRGCALRVSPESEEDDDGDPAFPVFDWRGAVSRYMQYHCILSHLCLSYRLVIILTDIQLEIST